MLVVFLPIIFVVVAIYLAYWLTSAKDGKMPWDIDVSRLGRFVGWLAIIAIPVILGIFTAIILAGP